MSINAIPSSAESKWDFRLQGRTAVVAGYFAAGKAKMKHRRNSVLESSADAYKSHRVFFKNFEAWLSLPPKPLAELFTFVNNSFPEERTMPSGAARDIWSTIFHVREDTFDKPNRDLGIAGYTSITDLQFDHMEDDSNRVWPGRRKAALDIWLGWQAAIQSLNDRCEELSRLLQSDGRYLLTGNQCPAHDGQNDFEARERGLFGYFRISNV